MEHLTVVDALPEMVYQNGHKFLNDDEKETIVIFGMSPGNSFFKKEIVEKYIRFLATKSPRVLVAVPHTPSEHTYKALGKSNPKQKAKKQSSHLVRCARAAVDNLPQDDRNQFTVLNWQTDVDPKEEYKTRVPLIYEQFKRNERMYHEISEIAYSVLKTSGFEHVSDAHRKESVEEAAKYLLDELAFFSAVRELHKKNVCIVYHREMNFIAKYAEGLYDGERRDWLGLVVVQPTVEKDAHLKNAKCSGA